MQEAQALHLAETCAWLRCLSLSASTRAAALLAARHAGGGREGGAPRTPRVPAAAERREVWRLMRDLVRRVEAEQRRQQLEDVTAQLMLLSAVRKVGGWDRAAVARRLATAFAGLAARLVRLALLGDARLSPHLHPAPILPRWRPPSDWALTDCAHPRSLPALAAAAAMPLPC